MIYVNLGDLLKLLYIFGRRKLHKLIIILKLILDEGDESSRLSLSSYHH